MVIKPCFRRLLKKLRQMGVLTSQEVIAIVSIVWLQIPLPKIPLQHSEATEDLLNQRKEKIRQVVKTKEPRSE